MNFSKKILFVSFSFLFISSVCLADKEFDAFDSYNRFDRMAEMKGMKIIARVKNAEALAIMLDKKQVAYDEMTKRIAELKAGNVTEITFVDRKQRLEMEQELLEKDRIRLDNKKKDDKDFIDSLLDKDRSSIALGEGGVAKLFEINGNLSVLDTQIKENNAKQAELKLKISATSKKILEGKTPEKLESDKDLAEELKSLEANEKYQAQVLADLKDALTQALKKPGIADVVMRGIAGKDAGDSLEEIIIGAGKGTKITVGEGKDKKETVVTDFGEETRLLLKGAGYGVLFRTSNSIGKELGNSIDDFVGKGFSSGTGALIGSFSYFNNLIFHGGNVPFETEEVGIWKSLIINDMRSLEKMLKDGSKNESRSRDMIERELGKDGKQKQKEQTRMIWNDFSDGFAEQCMYIVKEIGERKKHYKHKDLIVFYSSQLQKRLLSVAQLSIKMNSLKDFATLGEINSVFPSITKNMERLFTVLEKQIKASQFSFGKKKSSSFNSSNYSNGNDDYSGNYPNSFS